MASDTYVRKKPPKCVNCFRQSHLRGLCKICLKIPGLLATRPIPQRGNYAIHCIGIAPIPTETIPGSPERIEIMRTRVEYGFNPHHPDDLTLNVLDAGVENAFNRLLLRDDPDECYEDTQEVTSCPFS